MADGRGAETVEIRKGPCAEDGGNGIDGEFAAWNYHGTSFHVLVETAALGQLIVTAQRSMRRVPRRGIGTLIW